MRRGHEDSTTGCDQSRNDQSWNDRRKLYGDGDRRRRRDHGNDCGYGHGNLKGNCLALSVCRNGPRQLIAEHDLSGLLNSANLLLINHRLDESLDRGVNLERSSERSQVIFVTL